MFAWFKTEKVQFGFVTRNESSTVNSKIYSNSCHSDKADLRLLNSLIPQPLAVLVIPVTSDLQEETPIFIFIII